MLWGAVFLLLTLASPATGMLANSDAAEIDPTLISYRKKRGQTATGAPFYDSSSSSFDQFSSALKDMDDTASVSRENIQQLHNEFLNTGDDGVDVWKAWHEICQLVEMMSDIQGCLDTPSAETGRRATHIASLGGHVEKLKWLAVQGADMNAVTGPNTMGMRQTAFSPSHLAAMAGRLESLEILEKGGADIFKKAAGGFTPLDVAVEKGHKTIVSWLRSRDTPKVPTQAEL